MKTLIAIASILTLAAATTGTYFGISWQHNLSVKAERENKLSSLRKSVKSASSPSASAQTSTATVVDSPVSSGSAAHRQLIINYNNFGFMPNQATVPVGTKVTIENHTTEGGMYFTEAPGSPILSQPMNNIGIINKGATRSFTITQKGTYIYENAWETTDKGQITVQ